MLYFLLIVLLELAQGNGENVKFVKFSPESGMTTKNVKDALATDYGDHETAMIDIINDIRSNLLSVGGLSNAYKVIPIQGTDNYAIESTLRTITPKTGKVLIICNGFFGEKIQRIVNESDLNYCSLCWTSGNLINLDEIENHLKQIFDYTTVVVALIEASSSVINPIQKIGDLVKKYLPKALLVVDALASYGCFPFPFDQLNADYLLVSPGRCIQSFNGVSFVIAKKEKSVNTTGNFDSFSMDLTKGLLADDVNNVLCLPLPSQLFAAVREALVEFKKEGIDNRAERYKKNKNIIQTEFTKMGFLPVIPADSSVILTAFYYPEKIFDVSKFQQQLKDKGYFISTVSLTDPATFRIGHIGDIRETDCTNLVEAAKQVLKSMNISIPFKSGENGTQPKLKTSSWFTCRVQKTTKDDFTHCKHEIKKDGSVTEEEHSVKTSNSNNANTYAEIVSESHSRTNEKSDGQEQQRKKSPKWPSSLFKMPDMSIIHRPLGSHFEPMDFDNDFGLDDLDNNWDFGFP